MSQSIKADVLKVEFQEYQEYQEDELYITISNLGIRSPGIMELYS